MQSVFRANDGVELSYQDVGSREHPPLVLIHGFTGSGDVFRRNVPELSKTFRVIVPDLRGHGSSQKPRAGYHVSRLAMDVKNLIEHLTLSEGKVMAIGTSLGAAILWCYAELFTTSIFSHVVFVDQAPLQNYTSDWGPAHGNRGCNSPEALASLQSTLETNETAAHKGTIGACLGYVSHPQPGDSIVEGSREWQDDVSFFLKEALKGNGWWYGKLMADHTALDWRDAIAHTYGPKSGSTTRVLVVASSRSGCFPAAGPLKVVELVNGAGEQELAEGVTVDWGGHWCYWEKPDLFNALVLKFLGGK